MQAARRWALLAGLAVGGCGEGAATGDAGLADAGPPTWEAVQAIVSRSCTFSSCHGAARAFPRLAADVAFASLTTESSMQVPAMRLVAPGDPAQSWLVHKLDGTMAARPECVADRARCGSSMPMGVELLPAAERELIRAWIRLGAPGPRDR